MTDAPTHTQHQPMMPRGQYLRREPLYAVVEREISDLILSGKWKRGSAVPGEAEIATQYGVSVGTVRRALTSLVSTGFLERRPRHGTFVADRSPHHSLRFLFHYFRLHGDGDRLLASDPQTLSVETAPATPEERTALHLSGDQTDVVRIHRMRTVDGQPAAHDRMTLPAYRFPNFPSQEDVPDRVLSLLEDHYGIRFTSARESIWADVANEEDQRILGLPPGTPLLVIDQVAHDKTNTPVELFTGRFVSKGFRYINEVR